jgi:hypothetical protein
MKLQYLKGKTATIKLTIYSGNRSVIPTSATVTLYQPGGDTELQASASATIDATTGEMSYALTAVHTADNDLNYRAVWAYVVSGVTYYETQLFDVVKSILSIPITDNDLYAELDSLRKENVQVSATATSATSTTIVDTLRRKEPDNYWKGGTIKIIAGTGAGQERDITDFAQTTATITVSPAFGTTPDNTSMYQIVRSFTDKIQQAFRTLETMLYNKGKRHELILESSQIEIPLTYLTIHLIALDLMDEQNDKWDRLSVAYEKKFNDAFNNMHLEYDEDESGSIEGEETQANPTEFTIGRA